MKKPTTMSFILWRNLIWNNISLCRKIPHVKGNPKTHYPAQTLLTLKPHMRFQASAVLLLMSLLLWSAKQRRLVACNPTFRKNLSVQSSRSSRYFFWSGPCRWDGCYSETSVKIYQPTLLNIPEERGPQKILNPPADIPFNKKKFNYISIYV